MIHADKKLLETQFAADNFTLHKKMLAYYQGGMQGTTIASMATIHMMFSDIMRNTDQHQGANYYKMYLVYGMCIGGIVCALMNAMLTSTVKIYGNAALLCEASGEEVVQIIRRVRKKQEECVQWWLCCLVLLILQAAAWAWDSGNWVVLISESVVNVVGLYLMYRCGMETKRLLSRHSDSHGPLIFKVSLSLLQFLFSSCYC